MIKLKKDGSTPSGQYNFLIKKTHEKINSSWEEVQSQEEFMGLTIGDIIKGNKRFIIVAELQGKEFYIVTCDTDYKAVKDKYYNAVVIHAGDLINFAKKRICEADFVSPLPSIMIAMDVFPGAKILD